MLKKRLQESLSRQDRKDRKEKDLSISPNLASFASLRESWFPIP
jgi:hypothetical protein